jgi:hypothetical protein
LVNGINFPPEEAYTQDGKGSVTIGKTVILQADFRTPNAQKEALCAGFKKAPKECQTKIESTTTGTTSQGGC